MFILSIIKFSKTETKLCADVKTGDATFSVIFLLQKLPQECKDTRKYPEGSFSIIKIYAEYLDYFEHYL
jgi:hypothetical protein